jgi:primase-polymerase (primpol)-like protein
MEHLRACKECHGKIPWRRRTGALFCSNACKMREYRRRTRSPLPSEMRTSAKWVNHDASKAPLNARTGRNASSVDPRTWATYQQAARSNHGVGSGFVLSRHDSIACVDIDDCIDDGGNLSRVAQRLVREAGDTYVEISRSGRGIHIFGHGRMPRSGRRTTIRGQKVEAYDTGRYIAITGNVVGPVRTLGDIQSLLDYVDKY